MFLSLYAFSNFIYINFFLLFNIRLVSITLHLWFVFIPLICISFGFKLKSENAKYITVSHQNFLFNWFNFRSKSTCVYMNYFNLSFCFLSLWSSACFNGLFYCCINNWAICCWIICCRVCCDFFDKFIQIFKIFCSLLLLLSLYCCQVFCNLIIFCIVVGMSIWFCWFLPLYYHNWWNLNRVCLFLWHWIPYA